VPELPEVQTIVNDLNAAGIVGCMISRAKVFWPATIAAVSPAVFCRSVQGQTIEAIRRRGKFVLVKLLKGPTLAIHLRMTGRFQMMTACTRPAKHVHVILEFEDGRCLFFHDTRKFGRFYLADDLERIIGGLGPEPLDPQFTAVGPTETGPKTVAAGPALHSGIGQYLCG